MSKEPKEEKKCVIYYKTGWLNDRICMGDRFDGLDTCCDAFREKFLQTGNKKSRDWGDEGPFRAESEGVNFMVYLGKLALLLLGEPINFCFFCGADIEIKKSRNVFLKPKVKEVPNGYEELEMAELEKCH